MGTRFDDNEKKGLLFWPLCIYKFVCAIIRYFSCAGGHVFSSCKEIRDSVDSPPSGEYCIRTITGRKLDKVNIDALVLHSI